MISNEAIPKKEDETSVQQQEEKTTDAAPPNVKPIYDVKEEAAAAAATTENVVAANNTSDNESTSEPTTTTDQEESGGDMTSKAKEAESDEVKRRRKFNIQFQQKTKYLRDMWTEQRARINKDYSQFWIIIGLCFVAILASLASVSTSNWTCGWTSDNEWNNQSSWPIDVDSNKNNNDESSTTITWQWQTYGLWNTCNQQPRNIKLVDDDEEIDNNEWNDNSNNNNTTSDFDEDGNEKWKNSTVTIDDDNVTISWAQETWWCAKQDLGRIVMQIADQTRLDQVTASQSLISIGIFIYIGSLICVVLAMRFMRVNNNMNYVRNALITALIVQIFSFLLMLVGFFLFIYTDRLSISVVLLFVYFIFAIFATNLINFITIEYKTFKMRKTAAVAAAAGAAM